MSWDRCAIRRNITVNLDSFLTTKSTKEKEDPEVEQDAVPAQTKATGQNVDEYPRVQQMNICATTSDDYTKAREVVTKLAQIRFEYKDFIKVGLALYAGFVGRGRELWDIFLDNPNYNDTPATLVTHWRSFAGVRNTKLATLFYVGKQYGCNPS